MFKSQGKVQNLRKCLKLGKIDEVPYLHVDKAMSRCQFPQVLNISLSFDENYDSLYCQPSTIKQH